MDLFPSLENREWLMRHPEMSPMRLFSLLLRRIDYNFGSPCIAALQLYQLMAYRIRVVWDGRASLSEPKASAGSGVSRCPGI
jgi:hypothetical protein